MIAAMNRFVLLLIVVAACSKTDPQRADLEAFCSPEAAAKAESMAVLGPYLEPMMHDSEFAKNLQLLKSARSDINSFKRYVTAETARLQITPCPTLKMFEPHPAP